MNATNHPRRTKVQRVLLLCAVALLLALAGCAGGTGSGDGAPADGGGGGDGGAGWCPVGQSTAMANPETGEQVSLEFEGVVTYEGREVCKAVWEAEGGARGAASMEMYFSENDDYQMLLVYDDEGNVVSELQLSGPDSDGTASDGGPTAAGTTGSDGGQAAWCPTGQSFETSDPETGERVSLVYDGVVEQDGRELCKATWEADGAEDFARAEMYFDESRSYQRIVYFDASGSVVDEVVVGE